MKREIISKEKKKQPRSFEVGVDALSQRIVIKILDAEGMYPFLLQDPETGTYTILKTKNRSLQVIK